jgi:hypothetical protein
MLAAVDTAGNQVLFLDLPVRLKVRWTAARVSSKRFIRLRGHRNRAGDLREEVGVGLASNAPRSRRFRQRPPIYGSWS